MRKSILKAVLLLLICSVPACAQEDPGQVLKKKFPKLQVDSIQPTQDDGIYQVLSGDNVFYFAPKSSHIYFGEVWDSTGKNLTAGIRNQIAAGKHSIFTKGLSSAIKIGSGKHEVIEIIDPDCPYCRKMANLWDSRNDINREEIR